MGTVVKSASRLLAFLMAAFGLYAAVRGHVIPGGSFAGGVIMAMALALLVLVFGKGPASFLEGPVPAVFAALAVLAFACGFAIPSLAAMREPAAAMIKAAAGLYSVLAVLVLLRAGGEREDGE
jgi:multisubunit Na+/H+ antiporter MnhB subunit